jgi:hypothetical protein
MTDVISSLTTIAFYFTSSFLMYIYVLKYLFHLPNSNKSTPITALQIIYKEKTFDPKTYNTLLLHDPISHIFATLLK